VDNFLRAEIAEALGALTCIKKHQKVGIRNVLEHERVYRAYAEHKAITCMRRVFMASKLHRE